MDLLGSTHSEGGGAGKRGSSKGDGSNDGSEEQHVLAELEHQQLHPSLYQRTPSHSHPQGDLVVIL